MQGPAYFSYLFIKARYFWPLGDRYRQVPLYMYKLQKKSPKCILIVFCTTCIFWGCVEALQTPIMISIKLI